MAYTWGKASREMLEKLHPDMRRVVERMFSWQVMDVKVITTLRTRAEQAQKVKQGLSATQNSKHFPDAQGYAGAVDLAPFPIDWNDTKRFGILMGLMAAAAKVEGVEIRLGGNWDGDNDFHDNRPEDPGHFELVKFKAA